MGRDRRRLKGFRGMGLPPPLVWVGEEDSTLINPIVSSFLISRAERNVYSADTVSGKEAGRRNCCVKVFLLII